RFAHLILGETLVTEAGPWDEVPGTTCQGRSAATTDARRKSLWRMKGAAWLPAKSLTRVPPVHLT
ncbi:MAG: hypothetical protein ACREMY_05105, partial [bacterium]